MEAFGFIVIVVLLACGWQVNNIAKKAAESERLKSLADKAAGNPEIKKAAVNWIVRLLK